MFYRKLPTQRHWAELPASLYPQLAALPHREVSTKLIYIKELVEEAGPGWAHITY